MSYEKKDKKAPESPLPFLVSLLGVWSPEAPAADDEDPAAAVAAAEPEADIILILLCDDGGGGDADRFFQLIFFTDFSGVTGVATGGRRPDRDVLRDGGHREGDAGAEEASGEMISRNHDSR